MGLVHRQPYPIDGRQMKTELTASEPFTRGRIIAMFMAIALGTTPIVRRRGIQTRDSALGLT